MIYTWHLIKIQPSRIIEEFCYGNFNSASQMDGKVAALPNLVYRILVHLTSLPSYAIGSLILARRSLSISRKSVSKENFFPTSMAKPPTLTYTLGMILII